MDKVVIDSLNINGEGVGFLQDKKVCVKKVLKGEEAQIERVYEKKNFILGKAVNIVKKSPLRREEKCKYCSKCGGCDFMFVEDALSIKKEIIRGYFKDLYTGNIVINKSAKEFNYRNKVSFFVKDGFVGMQERGSNKVVKIDYCLVAKEEINEVLKLAQMYIDETNETNIHHIIVRSLEGLVSVVCVVTKKPKNLENFNSLLKNKFNDRYGLFLNYNTLNSSNILSDKFELIAGNKQIETEIFGLKFFIEPYSFMQINDDVRNKLYKRVLNEIEDEIVIEGYSGAGLLSCLMSARAKSVISIEKNRTATSDANKTKEANNITNLTNINGDCVDVLPNLIRQNNNATFVIDPPRKGVDNKILKILKEEKVKKIVYISCNLYTLKQNLVTLKDSYKVTNFEIFDMFPNTTDIESLVVLERR